MHLRSWHRPMTLGALLAGLLTLAACGGSGTPTPTSGAPAQTPTATAGQQEPWQAEWEQTLAAAKQEGTVIVSGPPGDAQRTTIADGFQAAYPDIKIDYTGARGTEIVSKVVQERQAGLYQWDVVIASTNPTILSFKPINALAPFRDALIYPDLSEDTTWIHGFENGFTDDDKKVLYAPFGNTNTVGYVNRDCVSEEQFNSAEDLKSPALADEIAWFDPTRPGASSRTTWSLAKEFGEPWLEDLMRNQTIVYASDDRQITDWLISCRAGVAIGIVNDFILQAKEAGIGQNIIEIPTDMIYENFAPGGPGGNTQIGWYNNAPHPNAAKVFINWYLSKDAQQAISVATDVNSRRLDTEHGDPATAMDPNKTYVGINSETATREIQALQEKLPAWMGR